MQRSGTVAMDDVCVPSIHRFLVVDRGEVVTAKRSNGQIFACTYRTELRAQLAAQQVGGWVLDRRTP